MLDRRYDQPVVAVKQAPQHDVGGLGRARGEGDLRRLAPEQVRDALARLLDRGGCRTSGRVLRGVGIGGDVQPWRHGLDHTRRSEEHTSELQSLMRISYAVFCLKKQKYIYHLKKAQTYGTPQLRDRTRHL